jgi:hypothetical protein
MTNEPFIDSRQDAARLIDIEACEITRRPTRVGDPYGLHEGDERWCDEDEVINCGTYFVRSPESGGWIWEGDLGPAKQRAMYDRLWREHLANLDRIKRERTARQ